jgi:hypothetical protein
MCWKVDFSFEEQLIHQLTLKSNRMKEASLFHGKLGVAIAFFEYGRFSENKVYTAFADELIDGFLSQVNDRTPFVFSSGLSGIGWGVEYLIQRGFVACDSNQVCADLDALVMRTDLRRVKDLTVASGMEGVLHYVLMRIKGAAMQNNPVPFDAGYFSILREALASVPADRQTERFTHLTAQFLSFMETGVCPYEPDLLALIEAAGFEEKDILQAKLGLNGGLAGRLLAMAMNQK